MPADPRRPRSALADVRRAHSATCAAHLRAVPECTVTELARATGMSRPTITSILADLEAEGLVVPTSMTVPAGREGGRPAQRYRLQAERFLVAGADVSTDRLRVVLLDLAGAVAGWVECPWQGGDRLAEAGAAVEALVAARPTGTLKTLGLSVPGAVDPATGVRATSVVLPEWDDRDLRAAMAEHTSATVLVENDLNLATVAEHRIGAGRGHSDLVVALTWHQVSAGIIINDRLHRGRHHAAGEISTLLAAETPTLIWTREEVVAEAVRRAGQGDAEAAAGLDRFVARAGVQVAALAMTIDPDVVVMGGALAVPETGLVDRIREQAGRQQGDHPLPPIIPTQLGRFAAPLGAALIALAALSVDFFGLDSPTITSVDLGDLGPKLRHGG